jgi:uncharacterized protein (TIGR02246 family)
VELHVHDAQAFFLLSACHAGWQTVICPIPEGSMKKLAAVLSVVTALVVTAIVQGQGKTEPALNKITADFAAAYNAKDAAKVAGMYAQDAVVMPPNEPMVKGRAAIEARLQQEMKEGLKLQLTPTESAIAGSQAYETGTVTVTLSGGQTLKEKYLVVYKRVGSDWKIAFDIWNSDAPATPK